MSQNKLQNDENDEFMFEMSESSSPSSVIEVVESDNERQVPDAEEYYSPRIGRGVMVSGGVNVGGSEKRGGKEGVGPQGRHSSPASSSPRVCGVVVKLARNVASTGGGMSSEAGRNKPGKIPMSVNTKERRKIFKRNLNMSAQERQELKKRIKLIKAEAEEQHRLSKTSGQLNMLDAIARGPSPSVPWSPCYRGPWPTSSAARKTAQSEKAVLTENCGGKSVNRMETINSTMPTLSDRQWSPTLSVRSNSQSQSSRGIRTPSVPKTGIENKEGDQKPPELQQGHVNLDRVAEYLEFIDNSALLPQFLRHDYCFRISDKYLLAMVYVYFMRAECEHFTEELFLAFLYLANDVAEDDEDSKVEILAWFCGEYWLEEYPEFYAFRDNLLRKMEWRVIVGRKLLYKVMNVCPTHRFWTRNRLEHHRGAIRSYNRPYSDEDLRPKGPLKTPLLCTKCVFQLDPKDVPTKIKTKNITWLLNHCVLKE